MSHFRKMEPFSEAALVAIWKWGCGGRSPPPGQTIFNIKLILPRLVELTFFKDVDVFAMCF